eukprot:13922913-Alexandrium_andersonii.AAC.1
MRTRTVARALRLEGRGLRRLAVFLQEVTFTTADSRALLGEKVCPLRALGVPRHVGSNIVDCVSILHPRP